MLTLSFLFSIDLLAYGLPGNNMNFTTREGLPSNETYKVIQDATGYIWVATDCGMARYDYDGFKLYGLKDGLGSLLCTGAQLDAEGKLVVYCYKNAFFRYNEVKDRFDRIETPELMKTLNVFDFYFDNENTLWFSLSGFRFYTYSSNGEIDSVSHSINHIEHKYSTVIYQGLQPLLSTQHKLNAAIPFVSFTKDMIIVNNGGCYHATVLSNGVYLATTSDEIIIADPITKQSKVFPYKTNQLESLYFQGEDLIFVGSGIYTLDDNWDLVKKEFLTDFVITSAMIDQEGNFWLSSHDHGLIRYFSDITSIKTELGTLTDVAYLNHKVYATSTTGHILEFDSLSGQIQPIHKFKQPQYELKIRKGLIYNRFGYFYDPIGGEEYLAPYTHLEGRYPIISNSFDQALQVCGLSTLQFYAKDRFIPANRIDGFKEIRHSFITENELFVCHALGISVLNYSMHGDSILLGNPKLIRDSCEVTGLEEMGHLLFFSTLEDGVLIYDQKSSRFQHLQDVVYLPAMRVNALKVYSDTLLVFSSNGFYMYKAHYSGDQTNFKLIHVLNVSSGLKSSDVRNGRIIGNYLVLVGDAYLSFVNLSAQIKRAQGIKINHSPLIISQVTDLIDEVKLIQNEKLDYYRNNLRFHFKYLSFLLSPSDKPFRIRLFRNGKEQLETYSKEPYTQFYNQDPGHYLLEVSAQDQFGSWTEPQNFVYFIKPHFTQTAWFRIGVLTFLLLMGYLLIHFRNQRKINQMKMQQSLDEETIKLKEATLSKFKLQINPHFVYNALNSIQYLFYEHKKEDANRYMNTFAFLLRKGIENSELLTIPVSEEIELIRSYISIEKLRFPDLFRIEVLVDEKLIDEGYSIPPHLVQPIVENAIKHAFPEDTGETGKILVKYEYNEEDEHIVVTVEDNGVGINSRSGPDKHNSKGLSIVQKQLSILNQSSASNSTMLIEDLTERGSRGTRVVISLAADII